LLIILSAFFHSWVDCVGIYSGIDLHITVYSENFDKIDWLLTGSPWEGQFSKRKRKNQNMYVIEEKKNNYVKYSLVTNNIGTLCHNYRQFLHSWVNSFIQLCCEDGAISVTNYLAPSRLTLSSTSKCIFETNYEVVGKKPGYICWGFVCNEHLYLIVLLCYSIIKK